jgi:hypothetical protein
MLPQALNDGYCQKLQYVRTGIDVSSTRQNPVKPIQTLGYTANQFLSAQPAWQLVLVETSSRFLANRASTQLDLKCVTDRASCEP